MIMADVLKIVFLILGILLCFLSYWLAAAALFPNAVERARERYGNNPYLITVIGLGAVILVGGLAAAIGSLPHPVAKAASVGIGGLLIVFGMIGSAGLCLRIGAGLASPIDDQSPWRRVLRGSIVLSLTFLFPFLGWFIVLPWAIASGLGATIMGFFPRRTAAQPQTITPSPMETYQTSEGTP